jgi:hypothetical protein
MMIRNNANAECVGGTSGHEEQMAGVLISRVVEGRGLGEAAEGENNRIEVRSIKIFLRRERRDQ